MLNEANGRCIPQDRCPRCYGRASGDPHYTTYDRRRYDLQDRCSHVFTKDCVNNTFAVYSITSNACSRGRAATCIEEALIDATGSRLRLYRKGAFLLHAFEGDVPDTSDVSVAKKFGGITVNLPKLGIVIQFRRWYLSVCAPISYSGKLCGLLGDCNGDRKDDFKLMNGTVTTDLLIFETEYRADDITKVCTVDAPQEATCNDPTKRTAAEAFCAPLLDRRGPYAACHETVDPQQSYDNCVLDHCLCDDDQVECGCTVILEYGTSCREMGINPGLPPAACCELFTIVYMYTCWQSKYSCNPQYLTLSQDTFHLTQQYQHVQLDSHSSVVHLFLLPVTTLMVLMGYAKKDASAMMVQYSIQMENVSVKISV